MTRLSAQRAHVDRHEVERLGPEPGPRALTTALSGISEKTAIKQKNIHNTDADIPQHHHRAPPPSLQDLSCSPLYHQCMCFLYLAGISFTKERTPQLLFSAGEATQLATISFKHFKLRGLLRLWRLVYCNGFWVHFHPPLCNYACLFFCVFHLLHVRGKRFITFSDNGNTGGGDLTCTLLDSVVIL